LILALGIWVAMVRIPDASSTPSIALTLPSKVAKKSNAQPSGVVATNQGALSIDDTEIDGELKESRVGELTVDADTRRFFDYFLTLQGEIPFDSIRTRLYTEAGQSLSSKAFVKAKALFERYVVYLNAAEVYLREHPVGPNDPSFAPGLHHLRQKILGVEVAAAFFRDDEMRLEEAIKRAQR
jgi:lipase chaperone LimK